MKNLTFIVIIGVAATLCICKAQEISMYGGRAQLPQPPPPSNSDGGSDGGADGGGDGDEVQDEGELASALGVDRQALYEDLMRIQEELGGSPLSPGPGPSADQNSQEEDY